MQVRPDSVEGTSWWSSLDFLTSKGEWEGSSNTGATSWDRISGLADDMRASEDKRGGKWVLLQGKGAGAHEPGSFRVAAQWAIGSNDEVRASDEVDRAGDNPRGEHDGEKVTMWGGEAYTHEPAWLGVTTGWAMGGNEEVRPSGETERGGNSTGDERAGKMLAMQDGEALAHELTWLRAAAGQTVDGKDVAWAPR